jgi:transposase
VPLLFIAAQGGRLLTEYLPSYAPELNPVEYLWGYWKHHALPNFCPDDLTELGYFGEDEGPVKILRAVEGIDRRQRGCRYSLVIRYTAV